MDCLREYQLILLEILKDVISMCNKMGIPYYMAEGTCLGAVRHKGFIPWDDDIDIAIPVQYSDLFFEGQKYLQPNYIIQGGRLEDDNLRVIDQSIKTKSALGNSNQRTHPWIDVFMLYGMPSTKILRDFHYLRMWYHHKMYKIANIESIVNRERGAFARVVIKLADVFKIGKYVNGKKHLNALNRIGSEFKFENSEYAVAFPTWYGKNEIMRQIVYGNGVEGTFEQLRVRLPSNYDYYLSMLYGDYMTPLSEDQRKGKHKLTIVSQ